MVALHAGSVRVIPALMTIFTVVVSPEVQSRCSEPMKSITAFSGNTVHLPCLQCNNSWEHFETIAVQWNKTQTLCHYHMEQNNIINRKCRDRFELKGHPAELYLRDLQLSDSGDYRCSVTRVIPPPALEIFSHQLKLHVIDITVGYLNSSDENCTQFWCMVVGLPNVEVNFTWSRETNGGRVVLQHRKHSTNQKNTLELCDGGWCNRDVLICSINSSDGISGFKKFTLSSRKEQCAQDLLMIIGLSVLPLAIILILLIIGCIIYRSRKRRRGEAMMYSNKVYENFSFTTPVPAPYLSEAEKHERCIYEN